MSLVRDTFLVGGATFLVGSVLMEISVKQEGEAVGWWPYVGTFIAGSLGFYLLATTNVVKVKNAEYHPDTGERIQHCSSYGHDWEHLHDEDWSWTYSQGDGDSEGNIEAKFSFKCKKCGANGSAMSLTPITPLGWKCEGCGQTWGRDGSAWDDGSGPCSCPDADAYDLYYEAEGPTDDELESWSERQDDGSMLVTIDEDGDSHTELTYKDGDLTDLKRFMAEIFEADRKARRRTTLTWTRGMEPSFYDKKTERQAGDGWMKRPRPYEVGGYRSDAWYSHDRAYHISGLPPGYHIHLWKPKDRRWEWTVMMKSPLSSRWERISASNKSYLMNSVLAWYNEDIATPEAKALTPVQELMISQGMISGDLKIQRVVPVPGQVHYFFEGGPAKHLPTKFASVQKGGRLEFESITIPPELLNFCRGLIYIRGKAGNLRSVNRYNKNRKQWVSSQPAWFQNMCKQGIKQVKFGKTWDDKYTIMGIDFLRFYGTSALSAKKTVTPTKGKNQGVALPCFQVQIPGEGEWKWTDVRPTTCRKMYDKLDPQSTTATDDEIFNQCVEKYQPQKWDAISTRMLEGKVIDNPDGWGSAFFAPAGQIMCRRFKKN